ncbi:MAG: ORF6N domain-containing protein [Candidatus Saganbacteria bacterium]|nr:ORF6N domain-containing protein [Candidatus Saganbacteria bacterium]
MSDIVETREIQSMIIEIRGQRVILDVDLAKIYCIPTKKLVERVKRNSERFPADFMFQLTGPEYKFLRSQIATSSWGGRRYLPYVFTRNGANMVSVVLRSPVAIQRSIQIMRAFTILEEIMGKNRQMILKSPAVMNKLSTHSRAIMHLFQKDKIKAGEIARVKKIINEMIELLKQMIFK